MLLKKKLQASLVALLVVSSMAGCVTPTDKKAIATSGAPSAVGPYSQAIKVGNMLFLSGQIPIDPQTGQANTGGIEDQTKQVMENLKAVLAANNMGFHDVVSATVFLKDLNDFSKMNTVYGSYFSEHPPARATIQASRLPRDVAVEVSAIAIK